MSIKSIIDMYVTMYTDIETYKVLGTLFVHIFGTI